MEIQVRIQSVPRDADADDDDALGESLVGLVRQALARGGAPAAAVIVRDDRIDLVNLAPVIQAKLSPARFLAGLTRTPIGGGVVEAVGVIGTFRLRRTKDDPGVPVAMVFLEWTDCRWWQWRGLLSGQPGSTSLVDGTETVLRAIDGSPKPSGLGGWWSLGRRSDVRFDWKRTEPVVYH